jgi:hypothetical protein
LGGIVCAVTGSGKGRVVLAGISILNLLSWFGDAMSL